MALELKVFSCSPWSWSNDVYRRIHQYQVARGFDPNTIDFARSIGTDGLIYKPIQNDSDRFEEFDVMKVEDLVYSRPPSPPVPYRSQMPDDSDFDTDHDHDADSDFPDSDASSIFVPSNERYFRGYLDTDSDFSDFDATPFAVYATSDSKSEVDNLCVRFGGLALD
ncbi:hypothetical protein V5O48_016447 [Marasmius crinis-equi]|uniref:Uncharacterized protein n=1 Tax=Marasmius crinis-equi TaxID=585013 RepID=A0ABR3ERP3_9AGAR